MARKKELEELVWPVEDYTGKLFTAVRYVFITQPNITFTVSQIEHRLKIGYGWLKTNNQRQQQVLDYLIKLALKRLTQLGSIKKVISKFSTEPQWMLTSSIENTAYICVTSSDSVAKTDSARKALETHPINPFKLAKLNLE